MTASAISPAPWSTAGAPRLTTRGRSIAVSLTATVLLLGIIGILLSAALALPTSVVSRGDGATVVASVPGVALARQGLAMEYTVRSGDTLWGLAVAQQVGEDPRVVVDRIKELSGKPDSSLVVGERLFLPAR